MSDDASSSNRNLYGIVAAISAALSVGGGTVAWTYFEAELKKQPWVVELVADHHKVEHLMKLSLAMKGMRENHQYLVDSCKLGDKARSDCRILGLEMSPRNSSVLLMPPSSTEGTP